MDPQISAIIDKNEVLPQKTVPIPGGRRRARAFARKLSIPKAVYSHLFRGSVWLCLVSSDRDRAAFSRLHKQDSRFVLIDPLLDHSAESYAAQLDLVVRYPDAFQAQLRLLLKLSSFGIAGVLVGCDLCPWIRHFIAACKTRGIRSVLVLNHARGQAASTTNGAPRNATELLEQKPWSIPSWHSSEDALADGPYCDYIVALSRAESDDWQNLGYPAERILRGDPVSPGGAGSSDTFRDALFAQEPSPTGEQAARSLIQLLASHPFAIKQPYEPADYDWLFEGTVASRAHPGVVAFHREIDEVTAFVPAMLGYRRLIAPSSIEQAQAADVFARWGGLAGEHRKNRLEHFANRLGRTCLLVEDGLFRSVEIGLSGTPTVSIMLDDKGAYYDATKPNRLEQLLSSRQTFTQAELARAERCIRLITEQRLSKYNHAPDRPLDDEPGCVLVVDQRQGDLSVTKGLGGDESFRQMLLAASRENPTKTVLVKRHPDALSGGKTSYYNNESLASWGHLPNVKLVDFETNPHRLFDICSKVYVVSSGMGFEALMRGLEVHCFGMPFYAGWGITHDRLRCPRRCRQRSLLEIFYVACILHSRYFNPKTMRPCSLEEVVEYLATARNEKFRDSS